MNDASSDVRRTVFVALCFERYTSDVKREDWEYSSKGGQIDD